MKLSEAILEGCKKRPTKVVGTYIVGSTGACALGAAVAAMPTSVLNTLDVTKIFPELNKSMRDPISHRQASLFKIIVHLNDQVGWTREHIAQWVAKRGF